MHELGVVFNIKQQIEDVAKENNVKNVTSLTIELGEVSTVVPELFTECFDWAKKKSEVLKNCKLNLIILKAITYCEDCKKTYSTTEFGRTCPYCKSPHTYLVTGNELKIKQIEAE